MTARAALPIIVALLATIVSAPAATGIPSPANSTVPSHLVGSPDGAFVGTVTVRDFFSNPILYSTVVLDFSDCPQFHPCPLVCTGCSANPSSRTVTLFTNNAGVADFDLRLGGGACPDPPTVHVLADGVLLGTTYFASLDQDGDLSVTPADVAAVHALLGTNDRRADFDGDGVVTSEDETVVQAHLGATCDNSTPSSRSSWGALKTFYR